MAFGVVGGEVEAVFGLLLPDCGRGVVVCPVWGWLVVEVVEVVLVRLLVIEVVVVIALVSVWTGVVVVVDAVV